MNRIGSMEPWQIKAANRAWQRENHLGETADKTINGILPCLGILSILGIVNVIIGVMVR